VPWRSIDSAHQFTIFGTGQSKERFHSQTRSPARRPEHTSRPSGDVPGGQVREVVLRGRFHLKFSEKFAELLGRKAGILDNAARGERVHGACLGMVRIRLPSVMTICLPCLAMCKPAFSNALTARR
jgi:hypothetical protein